MRASLPPISNIAKILFRLLLCRNWKIKDGSNWKKIKDPKTKTNECTIEIVVF